MRYMLIAGTGETHNCEGAVIRFDRVEYVKFYEDKNRAFLDCVAACEAHNRGEGPWAYVRQVWSNKRNLLPYSDHQFDW